jgi:serine/threonine-protein kinase HipA
MKECQVYMWDTHVGDVYEDEQGRIIFTYAEKPLSFEPSPLHAPYQKSTQVYPEQSCCDYLPGFIADALPDQYGEMLIEFFHKHIDPEADINIISKLVFIGHNTLGSIRFEPSFTNDKEKKREFVTAKELVAKARQIENGDKTDSADLLAFILRSSSLGGARRKAKVFFDPILKILSMDEFDGGLASIIKLGSPGKAGESNSIRVEYIYSLLAKEAKINIPKTYLIEDDDCAHYVIERFDLNHETGERFHIHSFAGMKHHNINSTSSKLDYINLFELEWILALSKQDKEQMYRIMIFNYIYRNQDDHGKNFSFLMDANGKWSFAPAYDLTYSVGLPRDHKLLFCGKRGEDVTLGVFHEIGKMFEIKKYKDIIDEVEGTLRHLPDLLRKHIPDLLWAGTILEDVRTASGVYIFQEKGFHEVWNVADKLFGEDKNDDDSGGVTSCLQRS